MLLSHFQQIVCPICATPCEITPRALICAHGHNFDLAREGYVNFLRKPLLGDTKEMLKARREFFAHGHYRPLSDAINAYIGTNFIQQRPPSPEPYAICDAGCGEGYYLNRLQASLAEQQLPVTCFGLDASKDAVRMAAKYCQGAFFIVANLKEPLPFADASLHVVSNIFAPRHPAEFARVLAPGGLLLVVIPAPTHLQTLRETLHLLHIEENKQQHVIAQFTEQGHFRLEETVSIAYELTLHREEVAQLVTMTPNYWHTTAATQQSLAGIAELRTEVACICLALRRI